MIVSVISNYACRNAKSEIYKYRTLISYNSQNFVVIYSESGVILEFFPVNDNYKNYGHVDTENYNTNVMDMVVVWCENYFAPSTVQIADPEVIKLDSITHRIISSIITSEGLGISILETTRKTNTFNLSSTMYFKIYSKKCKNEDCFVGLQRVKYAYTPAEAIRNANLVGNLTFVNHDFINTFVNHINSMVINNLYSNRIMYFTDFINYSNFNLDEIKTIEDCNMSDCSGDTMYEIEQQINQDSKKILKSFNISFDEPENGICNIWFESELETEIQSIEIPYRMLMNKYSDEISQKVLSERRIELWKKSINKNLDKMPISQTFTSPEHRLWIDTKLAVALPKK